VKTDLPVDFQFLYGEDGLEVTKTPFLQEKQLPFLLKNQHVLTSRAEQSGDKKKIEKLKKKVSVTLFFFLCVCPVCVLVEVLICKAI
jgi:hypothetical protein